MDLVTSSMVEVVELRNDLAPPFRESIGTSSGTSSESNPLIRVAAVIALVAVLAVLTWRSGVESVGPATGAAVIVPADALAYVHVSIDRGRPSVERSLTLAKRFPSYPLLSASVTSRLGAIVGGGRAVDFSRDIAPWLGNEAALALLNTTTSTADSLLILDVSDRHRARSFLVSSGATTNRSYRGAQLLGYPTGAELAFVGHYLVSGQVAGVRAAIDVAAGTAPSLQDDPTYRRAAASEPADRVLDA